MSNKLKHLIKGSVLLAVACTCFAYLANFVQTTSKGVTSMSGNSVMGPEPPGGCVTTAIPAGTLISADGTGGCISSGAIVYGQQTIVPVAPTRFFPGTSTPIFYGDTYFNSPITNLLIDSQSLTKVTSMQTLAAAAGRPTYLGPDPEMAISIITNSTPAVSCIFDFDSTSMDSSTCRITTSTLESVYNASGGTPYTVGSPSGCPYNPSGGGCDAHILQINTDNGILYEYYGFYETGNGTSGSPYHFAGVWAWDTKSYANKMANKPGWFYQFSSDGSTSADVSGGLIYPTTLQHRDLCGSGTIAASTCVAPGPIKYMTRIAFDPAIVSIGFVPPATHSGASPPNSNGVYIGMIFRIPAGYDTTTCHSNSNNGLPYPAYMAPLFTQGQTYGYYFADYGASGLISTDADPAWGNTSVTTSDNYQLAGWMHCIQIHDLQIIDPSAWLVNGIFSIQVNQGFVHR